MALFITASKLRSILREELAAIHFTLFQTIDPNLNHLNRMPTQDEIAQAIAAKTVQVRKAIDEITAKLAALEEAVRNNPPAQAVVDAVAALGAATQAADDIVPDAPAPAE